MSRDLTERTADMGIGAQLGGETLKLWRVSRDVWERLRAEVGLPKMDPTPGYDYLWGVPLQVDPALPPNAVVLVTDANEPGGSPTTP